MPGRALGAAVQPLFGRRRVRGMNVYSDSNLTFGAWLAMSSPRRGSVSVSERGRRQVHVQVKEVAGVSAVRFRSHAASGNVVVQFKVVVLDPCVMLAIQWLLPTGPQQQNRPNTFTIRPIR